MSYEFSEFGRHLGCGSGIEELMDDLGHAMASGGPDLKMLGGGQPARIPEMSDRSDQCCCQLVTRTLMVCSLSR